MMRAVQRLWAVLWTGLWARRPRLPMYMQMEANECGLACLAMLASHHGSGRTLAQLRTELPVSRKGLSVRGLVRMAQAMDLSLQPVRLELDAMPELTLPCILHWDMDHFVVLRRLTRRGGVIHDPAVGVRHVSTDEFDRRFSGVAILCEAGPHFAPSPPQPVPSLRRWLGPVPGLARDASVVLGVTLALELLAIAMPLLLQWTVDEALPKGATGLIDGIVVGFALLVVTSGLLELVRGWTITLFSSRLNLQWMKQVLTHLLRLPLGYFERRHVGDVATSFASITVIQQTLTHRFVSVTVDGLMSLGTLVMLLCISVPGAVVATSVLALYALARWGLQRPLGQATAEQIVHSARQQSHFLETLRGMQGLRLYARVGQRVSEWGRLMSREATAEQRVEALHVSHGAASRILFGLQRVGMVWMAAHAVLHGEVSLGLMFAFLTYLEQFSQRGIDLIDCAFDLALLRLHLDRVGDIVRTPTEAPDPETAPALGSDEAPLAIAVQGLSYTYAFAEPDVLSGINLSVAPGECVALAGPSGCGKTTLVKVLLGLHAPTEGEVFVNGMPLSVFGRERLRSMVGTVMQDDVLFTGSLAQNISFFDAEPDPQWIETCARRAAMHDDIMAMPMGYDTLVGEAGVGLSGGQKQRIMLARALYRRPRLLVLDEATSNLDVHSEHIVNQAVSQLSITRLIVAHRPQTLAAANRVVMMVAGRVVSTSAEPRVAPPATASAPVPG